MLSISVVIPSYNVEAFIEAGLKSVLNQTHAPLEIICVDDHSTDQTINIIRKMQVENPGKIKLFVNEENRGATYTRNRGLAVALGDYIQFLDADDILLPQKLELQLKFITRSNIKPDILAGSCKKIKVDGSERLLIVKEKDAWCALIDSKLGVTSSNIFNRKKLIEIRGWSDGLQSSQEYDLMFRMMKQNAEVAFFPEILNINRERETGSITMSNPAEMWKRYISLRIKMYDYLKQTRQLTTERKQTVINIIFDAIRFLHKYDPEAANQFHNEHVHGIGKPNITDSTSKRYLTLYHIFGFKAAQFVAGIHSRLEQSIAF